MNELIIEKPVYFVPAAIDCVFKEPLPMARHEIKVLGNGFPVCHVKFQNPKNNKAIDVWALIDTGANHTFLHTEYFENLGFEETDHIPLMGRSGKEDSKEKVTEHAIIFWPHDNWSSRPITLASLDFTGRNEYKAIIGLDLLRNCVFYYNGIYREAWVEM